MMDDDVNVYGNTEQKRLGEEVDSRDSRSAHDSILQELLGDAATSAWCLGELGQHATLEHFTDSSKGCERARLAVPHHATTTSAIKINIRRRKICRART